MCNVKVHIPRLWQLICPVFIKLRLISVYHPPCDSKNDAACAQLQAALLSVTNVQHPCIIVGDFNKAGLYKQPGRDHSAHENVFLQSMASMGLHQLVSFPTRGENYLDLLFTESPNLIAGIHPALPFSNSDDPPHIPIAFTVLTEGVTLSSNSKLSYANLDIQAAEKYLSDIIWEDKFFNLRSVSDVWVFYVNHANTGYTVCSSFQPG